MKMDHTAASESFKKLVGGLNKHFEGRFFVVDGTLLGLVRDAGFIAGDSDIDIGMWIEDFDDTLIADLSDVGITHFKTLGNAHSGLQMKFRDGDIPIDIYFYYSDGNTVWSTLGAGTRKSFKMVHSNFELEVATFQGLSVQMPSPPEKFLEANYGVDWRRPVKVWNYMYAQKNLVAEGSLFQRLRHKIRRASWNFQYRDNYLDEKKVAKRTIFTEGVFDLFHANHVALLQEAKARGDRLVVGIISDAAAQSYKRQPVIPQEERLRIVMSLSCVDEAFIFEGPFASETMDKIVAAHNIDTVVYAGDSTVEFYENVEQTGVLVRTPYHAGVNTSDIIARIVSQHSSSDK